MQGHVDEARKYLESDEGQKFEASLQKEFLGNKQDAGPAGASSKGDSSDPSAASASSSSTGGDASQVSGNAGQGEDSTSGMNSAPPERLNTSDEDVSDETANYNAAGRQQAKNEGAYTEEDTSSSGGYGTNASGDSFSAANQSGMGDNSTGQFGA